MILSFVKAQALRQEQEFQKNAPNYGVVELRRDCVNPHKIQSYECNYPAGFFVENSESTINSFDRDR